jgi:glucosamine-6-phosphate deaminase
MGEGWFATIDDVPKQAVSMTTYQIMLCRRIVSCVPHKVKAEAIKNTLSAKETTNMVPATLLKEHPDFILYIDENSASEILNY